MASIYRRGEKWSASILYPIGHAEKPAGGWASLATGETDRARALAVALDMQDRVSKLQPARPLGATGPVALLTLEGLATRFLAEYRSPKITDLDRYRAYARIIHRGRILPYLGARPAAQITRGEIIAWQTTLSAKLSPGSCNVALTHLSAIFSWAVDAEILQVNPCARVRRQRSPVAEDHLSAQEAGALLALDPGTMRPALRAAWYKVAIILLAGLRYGETRALPWSCVDFARGVLTVAYHNSPGRKPKGGKVRTIPLHPQLALLLRELRASQGEAADQPGALVFPRRSTLPLKSSTDRRREPLAELAELARVHVCEPRPYHGLRHTFATWLHRAGAPVEVVARILGHAGPGPAVTRGYIAPPDLAYLAEHLAKLSYPKPAPPADVIDLEAERARRGG